MTRDDIIRMAREAELQEVVEKTDHHTIVKMMDVPALERFAALVAAAERDRVLEIAKGMQEELQAKFEQNYMQGVIAGAAAEREACAKVCESLAGSMWVTREASLECSDAIRARGQE